LSALQWRASAFAFFPLPDKIGRRTWPVGIVDCRFPSAFVVSRILPADIHHVNDIHFVPFYRVSTIPTDNRTHPLTQSCQLRTIISSRSKCRTVSFLNSNQNHDIIGTLLALKVGRWDLVEEQTRSQLSAIHNFRHILECIPEISRAGNDICSFISGIRASTKMLGK